MAPNQRETEREEREREGEREERWRVRETERKRGEGRVMYFTYLWTALEQAAGELHGSVDKFSLIAVTEMTACLQTTYRLRHIGHEALK